MIPIIKYLTPRVILDLNSKIYQNGGWGALYTSDRGFKNSHSEEIEVIYLEKNTCIIQNTSTDIVLDALLYRLYVSIWEFNNNKHRYMC